MNIQIFNRDYVMRRYAPDGSFVESTIHIHLYPEENGTSVPWAETEGIVRHISGHGMVPLREADIAGGTKADRVLYKGRWYECTSSALFDHTVLAHYNYQFIVLPEEAVETITLFNSVYDEESGYDRLVPTVIRGVAWVSDTSASAETTGLRASSQYTVQIPEDADFSGKTYVEPVAFNGEGGTFTLTPGDIIVKGEETELIIKSELLKKYRGIITVLHVYDFRKAPNHRHWKVVGNE